METYQEDSYLRENKTRVKSAKGKFIILEDTIFYPKAGGQPCDLGTMTNIKSEEKFEVVFVGKFDGNISHEVDNEGLKEGDTVKCCIDWDRRHMLMKYHTAMHILSKVIYKDTGAVTCGNQLNVDKSRVDLTLENANEDMVRGWLGQVNDIIAKGLAVKTYEMSKDDALKINDFIRTSTNFVDKMDDIIRIVDIVGYDKQACGGTHVKNTSEIGKLKLVNIKNKGKNNKRIYFTIL